MMEKKWMNGALAVCLAASSVLMAACGGSSDAQGSADAGNAAQQQKHRLQVMEAAKQISVERQLRSQLTYQVTH